MKNLTRLQLMKGAFNLLKDHFDYIDNDETIGNLIGALSELDQLLVTEIKKRS